MAREIYTKVIMLPISPNVRTLAQTRAKHPDVPSKVTALGVSPNSLRATHSNARHTKRGKRRRRQVPYPYKPLIYLFCPPTDP